MFTGNQDAPSPNCARELGKEEKAWDGVQLHLPAAVRPYMRVGQSFSLMGMNSHRAKAEEQGPQCLWSPVGLALLTLLVVEDPGQSAAGLFRSFFSRDWAVLAVFIPWQIDWLECGMWFFLLTCPDGVVHVPLFPQIITVWMLLSIRRSCFTSIYIYVQG